jgi:hypothetical protein
LTNCDRYPRRKSAPPSGIADVVTFADLVAVELRRLGAVAGRDASPPLELLRRAGREVDVPVGCLVDGARAGQVVATLDRTVVVQYADCERQTVRVDRVQVEAADVRWRDAQYVAWGYESIDAPATQARRGRAFQLSARKVAATLR